MSKSAKRVFKIVGIAALGLATFGVGSLLAGGAAIGSALGGGIAVGSLSVSFSTLVTVGLAALSIGTLPDVPSLEKTGANNRGQAILNPDALGVFAFGNTTVPLNLVYERAVGENDEQVENVFAHAWHRIESYEALYIEGEEVTFDGDDAEGDWAGILTWLRADGTQSSPLSVNGWGNDSVFAGVAHSAFRWKYKEDSEKLRGGIPTRIDVVVKGAWLYDPREDASVGGSGSQDLEDPSTWTYNNGNAALVLLRYLIGEYSTDGELIWGRGAGYDDIDMDSFITMANVADETVDGKPRYRLGGIHLLDGSFENFVRRWEQETGGKLAKVGGKYTVWLPHDDLTPLTTITEDMLLAGPIQHTVSSDIRQYYNCARGRYIEPNEGYRGFPYPEVTEDTEIADDGSKCPLFQDFSWVQDVEIAQRVARIRVRRSRFQRIWTVPMGWEGQLPTYAPFTVHTLNIPETGNDPQLVRVIDRKMSMDGQTILVLQQEDSSIYDDTVPLGDPHASNTTGPRVYHIQTVRSIGEQGPPGAPGEDAISIAITPSNGIQWRQGQDGTWSPSGTTTDITFEFIQGGEVIAEHVVRVTRSDATLTASTQSESGDATTEQIFGNGTSVVSIVVTHDDSGVTAAQSVSAVQSGAEGPAGSDGRIKQYVFRRSTTQPATPTGNGIPSGWSDTPPADNGQPLWTSVALQELDGTTIGSWSTPIRLDGQDGATWHSGNGAPAGSLGNVGDFYLDEQTGNVYEKTGASTWTLRTNISGPEGPPGAPGADGADGESYWTPVLVNVTRSGKTFTKTGGTNSWGDASVYSAEGLASCQLSFRASQTNAQIIIGLNTDPATNHSFETIDAAFALGGDGTIGIYESGALVGTFGTYTTSTVFTITYDGYYVRYWVDNTLVRSLPYAGQRLFLDSSFNTVGGSVNQLIFQAGDIGQIDLTTKVSGILSEAFIAAGALNQNITINPDGTLSGAGGGQVQIGQLPGSVAVGQLTTNLLAALNVVAANLSAINADLGTVTAGKLNLSAQTFTPTWETQFGTPPSGTISYVDLGCLVMMFTTAALTGTSNGVDPTFIGSGIPSAIRPTTSRMVPCVIVNNNVPELGLVDIQSNGNFALYRAITTSGAPVPSASAFSHSNSKGLPDDWMIVYPK